MKDREKVENDKEREQQHGDQTVRKMVIDHEDRVPVVKLEENGAVGGNFLFGGNGLRYLM